MSSRRLSLFLMSWEESMGVEALQHENVHSAHLWLKDA